MGVRVKPLQWEKVSSHIHDAQTGIGGMYRVRRILPETGHWVVSLNGAHFGWLDTEREAMEFAYAHHVKNIMSCIEPEDASHV